MAISISNGGLTLSFCKNNGRLVSAKNDNGKEFIVKNDLPLFSVGLLENGEQVILNSSDAQFSFIESEGIDLCYKGISNRDFNMVVHIKKKDRFLAFSFDYENNTNLIVEYVDIPAIVVARDLLADGGESSLFWPGQEGVVVDDLSFRFRIFRDEAVGDRTKGWEGLYPGGAQMQFMAYYSKNGGLYLATHDDEGNLKGIDFRPKDDNAISLQYRLFIASTEKSFKLGYDFVLCAFDGDWHDAADIYYNWIKDSKILKNMPKLKDNANFSKWVFENPVVVAYCVRGTHDTGDMTPNCYYPFTNANKYIRELNKKLDSKVLALLMHWEGTAPWAPPFVWPPYGGVDNFKEYCEQLHKDGNYLGVYCSGIGWTEKSLTDPSYNLEKKFIDEGWEKYMCMPRSNKLIYSYICAGWQRWGYDFCSNLEKTKEVACNELDKMLSTDIDYIQFFDQNIGGLGSLCYSDKHGHPASPGKWQTDSMKKLFANMREVVKKHNKEGKVMIGCEAAPGETFINDLFFSDLRFSISWKVGIPVPAYNYLYNEYTQNFMGNQNSFNGVIDVQKYPESIYLRYAYSFLQGDVLTIVLGKDGEIDWDWGTPWDITPPDQEKSFNFIKLLNDWRKGAINQTITFGKMKKPLDVICDEYAIPHLIGTTVHHFPSVMANRFVGKEDIQILVNYRDFEQKVRIDIKEPKEVKLICTPDGKGENIVLDNQTEIEIPPRSVVVIQFI